jgi:hypothetical protein
MSTRHFDRFANKGNRRDWREICDDVLKEKSAQRVDELLDELLDVLEERAGRGGGPTQRMESPMALGPERPLFGFFFGRLGLG